MTSKYYLEDLLYHLEKLAKYVYFLESTIIEGRVKELLELCPIFEKNNIVREETWFFAQEKIITHIDFLDDNNLSYQIESDFLEIELPVRIQMYEKYLDTVLKNILEEKIKDFSLFFISNILFDLGRLLIRYYAINVELEIHHLAELNSDKRDIELARIIDDIQSKLSYGTKNTDYVIKKHLLRKRKRLNTIFNRSNDQSIKSISSGFALLSELIRATKELQGKRKSVGDSEKDRTIILTSFIQKYIAKDESGYGISETGKSMGEIDIKIENKYGEVISICEAFNLKRSFEKNVITRHLKKVSGYNANGLEIIFIIIFCELKNFSASWLKYVNFIETVEIDSYLFLRGQELTGLGPAKMKICETVYRLNGNTINMYHLFLDMK